MWGRFILPSAPHFSGSHPPNVHLCPTLSKRRKSKRTSATEKHPPKDRKMSPRPAKKQSETRPKNRPPMAEKGDDRDENEAKKRSRARPKTRRSERVRRAKFYAAMSLPMVRNERKTGRLSPIPPFIFRLGKHKGAQNSTYGSKKTSPPRRVHP